MGAGFVRAGRSAAQARPKLGGFNTAADRTRALALAGTKALAGMAGAFLSFAAAGAAVRAISEFESSVSKMGAISGATAAELEAMRNVAKDLGSTTEFSAKQAADGLTFLSMAGFEAAESIAAIPAVLDLATSAGIGLAQAADTASNIMSGFGIAATEAASVSDVLAAASSRANTSVSQLGGAMSTVAPIASALDIGLADTAAAIGVLSDAGIQGERAGTAMRGVLASLAGPTTQAEAVIKQLGLTIQDIDPATNSLSEVMGRLGSAGLTTADAMTLFGREAASGALVLIEGSQRLGEFGQELRNVDGAAADMARTMRDNLRGDIDGLQSAVSGLMLAMGEAGLTAVLRFVVSAATGVAQAFIAVFDTISAVGDAVGSLSIFRSATDDLALSADATNVAIADEIAQIGALTVATGGAVVVSELAALNKLREAEAHLESAAAKQAEARATILNSDAYQNLIQSIETGRDALRSLNSESAIGAAAYEETEQSLVSMLERQKEMLALIPETSSEYEAAAAAVEDLRQRIDQAKDGTVILNGEIAGAADTTAALARLSGDIGELGGYVSKIATATYEAIPALKELQGQFGANADAMRGVLEIQNELAQADASAGIAKLAKDASDLASQLGVADKQAKDFQSAMQNIAEMDGFQRQSEALAGLASHLIDAAGGVDNLNTEARKVVDNMLAAAIETSGLAQQIAIAEANSTALGAAIARIAPQFAPAIGAANQLARALGGVLAQLGGVARGLAALSPIGNAVATSLEGVGNVFNSVKTGGLRAASTVIGEIGGNLANVWAQAKKAGTTTADLSKTLKRQFTPAASGGGGAAKGLSEELKASEKAAEALQKAMDRPLLTVIDGASRAIGDFVASGLTDFKSLGRGILDSITSAISQAVQFAIANPIKVAFGLSGGLTGGAANGSSGGGVLSGLLGKALGKFGGEGSILGLGGLGGGKGLLGGLGNALSGGIGGLFKIGANAAAAGGGLLATLGAAAPVLGIVTAAFSFFKKKVTELDAGLRVTATGMDALIETFRTTETRRFWGLSKKVRTNYSVADTELADPIQQSIDQIGQSVIGLSDVLNLQSANIDASRFEFEISTKGKSDEQIQKEIETQLGGLADEMAKAIVGSYTEILPDQELIDSLDAQIVKLRGQWVGGDRGAPERRDAQLAMLENQRQAAETAVVIEHMNEEFAVLQRSGEGTFETLTRLSTSLSGVNTIFDTLGLTLLRADLAGGGLASTIIDAVGGLEQFDAAATAYYQRFYTDAERTEAAFAEVSAALGELGVVMPKSVEGFRALVEQADAMGDPEKAARLIGLAGAFADVMNAVDRAAQDAERITRDLAKRRVDAVNAAVNLARSDLTAAENSAKATFSAAIQARREELAGQIADLTASYESATKAAQLSNERELQSLRAAFESSSASLEATLTDARERLSNASAIADALEGALSRRIFPGVEQQRFAQDQAANYLRSLVQQGEVSDADALQDALALVANPATDTYKTLEDYRLDFNRQTGTISALKEISDVTLSTDKQMVRLLEDQIDAIEAQFDAQISASEAASDALLKSLQEKHDEAIAEAEAQAAADIELMESQLNALLQINNNVLGMASAITGLKSAQEAYAAALEAQNNLPAAVDANGTPTTDGLPSATADLGRLAIEQIYQQELGRAADAAGLKFYLDNLIAGITDINRIQQNINNSAEGQKFDLTGIPSFSGGGWTGSGSRSGGLDGEGGFLAMMHPRERVIDDTKGGSSEMAGEIRQLRGEMKALLLAVARNTGRTARDTSKWDNEGLPGTAAGEVVKTEAA
ncbi:MAG: phage tail tape measure protein [Pikeienuella sp.]